MSVSTPILTLCGLCGTRYSQSAHSGCQTCPLNDGCLMTCCPKCGYSAPDEKNSKLLAAGRSIAERFSRRNEDR